MGTEGRARISRAIAAKYGIVLKKRLDLPANNFILVFGKA